MSEEQTIIDALEKSFVLTETTFCRLATNLINFEFRGEWQSYTFYVAQRDEAQLCMTVEYPVQIQRSCRRSRLDKLNRLFNRIHQDMPLGTLRHDLIQDGLRDRICWFHKAILTDNELVDMDSIEILINEACQEVDEFYPCIQQILVSGSSVEAAYNNAIPLAYGHA
jgi:hypothetical protein